MHEKHVSELRFCLTTLESFQNVPPLTLVAIPHDVVPHKNLVSCQNESCSQNTLATRSRSVTREVRTLVLPGLASVRTLVFVFLKTLEPQLRVRKPFRVDTPSFSTQAVKL